MTLQQDPHVEKQYGSEGPQDGKSKDQDGQGKPLRGGNHHQYEEIESVEEEKYAENFTGR